MARLDQTLGALMDLNAAILQLRKHVPMFGGDPVTGANGRVAGAADFAQAIEDQAWMELPAAYVIPLDEDSDENPPGPGLDQHISERIGVIVELDNRADRRGQASAAMFAAIRAAVFAALLNWRIDPVAAAQGLNYGGGRLLQFDRARLFYQWEFTLRRLLTDADGWQEPTPVFAEIDVTVRDDGHPAGPGLQVLLPQ